MARWVMGWTVAWMLACAGLTETDPPVPDAPREGKGKAGKRPVEEPGEGDEADRPSPPPPEAAPRDGIEQVGPSAWTVTRGKADALADKPGTVGDLDATKAGGWKVERVGPDGAALGLALGDVIREVNGYPLGNDVELAVAWAALHDEDVFHVKIRRDGVVRTHRVDIVQ